MRTTFFLLMIVVLGGYSRALAGGGQIPALNWEKRSDWVSVKTDVTPAAKGDGIADDTAAIQKALNAVTSGSVVYFPAGTYRVTGTLRLTPKERPTGVMIVGHGRDSRLVWDGPAGQPMWIDSAVTNSRYIGLVMDGCGKATIGLYHHNASHGFETEVGHRHMAFLNFTDTGILAQDAPATAETMTENCLFENCGRGIGFLSFNDYDFTIDGCEFRHCQTAIECQHGNTYVRNCHFEASGNTDLLLNPEHGSSVRRCTSVGSKMFVRYYNGVAPLVIEDCHVADWTNPEAAVSLGGAPVVIFDCAFTQAARPATTAGAAAATPGLAVRVGGGQRLFLSGNVPAEPKDLIQGLGQARVYVIPPGKRKGVITSAHTSFLTDIASIPTAVFDAKRDFGAKGDGNTDDTAAIQKTIDAARQKGGGAIAYLPSGYYAINKTLDITGADYFFGGTGFHSALRWKGAEGGTMVQVHDPQHVIIENLAVGNHDAGQMNNGIDILQTSSDDRPSSVTYDNVSVYGMYQKKPFVKGLWLRGLSKASVVAVPRMEGNVHLVDAAQATIVVGNSYEGSVVVEGKDPRRGGFQGFLTHLGTICTHALYVKDNQSLVASDFYIEQADNGYSFAGSDGDPPGRVTIQSPKLHMTINPAAGGIPVEIRNYSGQIFLGPEQFYIEPLVEKFVQSGGRPLTFILWASSFYMPVLAVEKSPAANVVTIGNISVGQKLAAMAVEETKGPEAALEMLSGALDDLRALGEADLRVNHHQ